MGRLEHQKQQKDRDEGIRKDLWPILMENIDDNYVIPIISNSIINEQLFDLQILEALDEGKVPDCVLREDSPLGWSIEDQQAIAWASSDDVKYPLPEQHWLPRVALYDRVVKSANDRASKKRYFNWLKCRLLLSAKQDETQDQDEIDQYIKDHERIGFANLARKLNYPKPMKCSTGGSIDALEILANLPLSIYITTSPFDFLEKKLIEASREPHTQICFWRKARNVHKDHETNTELKPDVDHPLVFHLFGLENYFESVVLNEDDYLDFLKAISKDDYIKEPLVPVYLRSAITQSSLVLLGYRLRDWEFRVMFRGLINPEEHRLNDFQLAIQMNPSTHSEEVPLDMVRSYLRKYFRAANFRVEWSEPQDFVATLWDEWNRWRI